MFEDVRCEGGEGEVGQRVEGEKMRGRKKWEDKESKKGKKEGKSWRWSYKWNYTCFGGLKITCCLNDLTCRGGR